ncbi:hypothetical protein [Bartonella choladocola]|uniref:Uncharacterized protein n=1 Tax=Bartonella choladocola TaxID=2750995 RepID=A0A1U9MJA0_9HYPH|nr:hypothetical protein [Bartonella choladocola]AQT47995.1 hypothetical protein BBC0122_019000 [Bartonella choladocola]
MSDHVYGSIKIGGEITTIDQLEGLVSVIFKSQVQDEDTDEQLNTEWKIKTAIFEAIKNEDWLKCYDDEARNGEFPVIEDYIKETDSLAFTNHFYAGTDFSEGYRTILPGSKDEIYCDAIDGNVTIDNNLMIEILSKDITEDKKLKLLTELTVNEKLAAGVNLPKLTASATVIEHLEAEIAKVPQQFEIKRSVTTLEIYHIKSQTADKAIEIIEKGIKRPHKVEKLTSEIIETAVISEAIES